MPDALTGNAEFIFDVHTHHVIPSGPWVKNAPDTLSLVLSMLPPGCTDTPELDCVDRATYLHDLFLASDTTVAMLTDVPNSGPSNAPDPFSRGPEHPADHRGSGPRRSKPVAGGEHHRPQRRAPRGHLDEMSSAVQSGPPAAFKVYTAWSPTAHGFSLEDPTIGLRQCNMHTIWE